MECPGARNTETISVDLANCLPKCQHTIKEMQVKAQYFTRTGIGAMMRVVKERFEPVLALESQHLVGNNRISPFVDDDDIHILHLLLNKRIEGAVVAIEMNIKIGVSCAKLIDGHNGLFIFVFHKIAERP